MRWKSVITFLTAFLLGFSHATAVSHLLVKKRRYPSPHRWSVNNNHDMHPISRPWRGNGSNLMMLSAAAVTLPSKRAVLTVSGLLSLLGLYHMQQSEPIRRSLYFWTKAGPIVAHYKFTKRWLNFKKADRARRDEVYETLHNRYADAALDLVLHLKGLYVKMGQIMANRPDFMPSQYIQVFTQLQDSIPAWDTSLVRRIAIRELTKECTAFADYDDLILDEKALGSASIGQVHRGVLVKRDFNGRNITQEVAVKVMHEGSKERFQHDFQVFRWLCRVAIPSWRDLLDALEKQVMTEFCYRNEAKSLKEVRRNMLNSPYKKSVCVPEPMEELCCREVLIMEMLHGKKLVESIKDKFTSAIGSEKLASDFISKRQNEVLTGEDFGSERLLRDNVGLIGKVKLFFFFHRCRHIIDLLVECHGHQIFKDGVWNGDPHFGNCLQLDDGRIGLIDYGQTRRIDDALRRSFANVVVAIEESRKICGKSKDVVNQFDEAKVANAMRQAGFETKDNSDDHIMLQYARLLFDSDEEGAVHGWRIPQEYFSYLMHRNPLVSIPDSAIFVARTSLMFRGMGHAIGSGQIRTATRWYKHAKEAS